MNKTVLILTDYYVPGSKGGGPIRSLENLVSTLGEELQFRIVTRDRDLGDKASYPEITVENWVRVGNADVLYTKPGLLGFLKIASSLYALKPDAVLYLNSYWSRPFSLVAMLMLRLGLCRPLNVILAPRGEFSPGALNLKMRRKRIYMRLSRLLGFYDGIIWHASNEMEARHIKAVFPEANMVAAPNIMSFSRHSRIGARDQQIVAAQDIMSPGGPCKPRQQSRELRRSLKRVGELHAVYLSRIVRNKNLDYALGLLKGLSGEVTFNIFGPAEDAGYWSECEKVIRTLPSNVRVNYQGEVKHDTVDRVFSEHDLFLFPTSGENYGHVICESLAAGCPVLLSDQTPWRNLEKEGVGWDIPLDDKGKFQTILQRCIDANAEWLAALSVRASEYAKECLANSTVIDDNRAMFHNVFNSKI